MSRTEEVSDVSSIDHDPDTGIYTLTPRREGALGVYIGVDEGEPDALLSFDADWAWIDDANREQVDEVLDAAIDGRVRVLFGPGRYAIQRRTTDTFEEMGVCWESPLLLPRPGWRKRARVVEYLPYRQ
ncbi:hypothetical protein [Aeromicrobium sp. CTD01-1L150]|uniref:hypothetical protein n=1 Tax=Aeromicrobium sp. CTD01-1L150 TaxID=3341830 RepID=UPI0035BF71FB